MYSTCLPVSVAYSARVGPIHRRRGERQNGVCGSYRCESNNDVWVRWWLPVTYGEIALALFCTDGRTFRTGKGFRPLSVAPDRCHIGS